MVGKPNGMEANAINAPLGKYSHKTETQMNRRGVSQTVEHVP